MHLSDHVSEGDGTFSNISHPPTFSLPYLVAQPTPYCFLDSDLPRYSGGVLRGGSTVWLREPLPPATHGDVCAFADGLGRVSLDGRWLIRGRTAGTATEPQSMPYRY